MTEATNRKCDNPEVEHPGFPCDHDRYGVLTASDVQALHKIITSRGQKVARDIEGLGVVYGEARSIGDLNGNFLMGNTDVRDAYLRVTLRNGLDVFWLVSDLMPEVHSGLFAQYDWSEKDA